MGPFRLMTAGFLLILVGIQLWCVKSYSITPKAAKFVQQRIMEVDEATAAEGNNRRFFSTAFSNPAYTGGAAEPEKGKPFSPPSWLKWAALFAGSVLFLRGAAVPK